MQVRSRRSVFLSKSGFTLIELLVVVLIIGILAAVALPQYNKVIYKARYTQAIVVLESLNKAQQAYYSANGKYTTKFADLDIEPPAEGKLTEPSDGDVYEYKWGSCKMHNNKYGRCSVTLPGGKAIWYFKYWEGNRRQCWVPDADNNPLGISLCETFTQRKTYGTSSAYRIYTFQK